MAQTKRIKDLDQLRTQAFPPPIALIGAVEDAEARGEPWWALMAYGDTSGEARWVVVFPEAELSLFFTEGDQLNGRWDQEHEVFFPEDGLPLNLLGMPVSMSALEEEAEEEEEWRNPD